MLTHVSVRKIPFFLLFLLSPSRLCVWRLTSPGVRRGGLSARAQMRGSSLARARMCVHRVRQPESFRSERSDPSITPNQGRRTNMASRDENGSDTNGYHLYYICFYISVRIRIRTRIAFGYRYEYGLTRLRIRIMSIEYGMNRIRRRSDTNIYSDIE
jgi:hypothetical protein